jgi:hypothetical protein
VRVNDGQSRSHFYDSPWFKGIAAVVALLVGVAALIGPLRGLVGDLFAPSSLPLNEYEVVFDSGKNMNQAIAENTTKLDKAKQQLKATIGGIETDGLALRTFDGKCNQTQKPLDVGFGANHNDDVINKINQLDEGSGSSNLYAAVLAAVQDFNDLPTDTIKHVFVYVGAIDSCGGATGESAAESAAHNINNILQDRDIQTSFKFFTFKLTDQEELDLKAFKRVLPQTETVPIGSGETLSQSG